MTRHAEIAKANIKVETPATPMTQERCDELAKRITQFTTDLITGLSRKDPATG
jgi:hypothetical protein